MTQPEPDEAPLPCDGKLSFDTKKDAVAAATVARHRYGSDVSPYVCRHCGLWHLATNYK